MRNEIKPERGKGCAKGGRISLTSKNIKGALCTAMDRLFVLYVKSLKKLPISTKCRSLPVLAGPTQSYQGFSLKDTIWHIWTHYLYLK